MKKFFKLSALTKPASFIASKLGKKKHSVKDDFEEVSELPDLDVKDDSVVEENIIEQASAPVDESLVDPLKKMDILENRNPGLTLLINQSDETFSSPSFDPYFQSSQIKIPEPVSLNVSSVSTVKYYEKPERNLTLIGNKTKKIEEDDIMQKKVDELEKISEKQTNEINELRSIINDCLTRITNLEGGSKTANKEKSSPTPNSLKITSPKDVQLRKSMVSPRTPVKATRLSGTPTRRSTSDLAKIHKRSKTIPIFKKPWKPPGGLMICPIIIKTGQLNRSKSLDQQKITNQICNQLANRNFKISKKSCSWRPPGISILFCNFTCKVKINQFRPMLKLNLNKNQYLYKSNKNYNHKEATFIKGEGVLRIFIKGRPINLYVPNSLADGFDIKSPIQEPQENLRMEWVYGYRGKDCRKNLYYLPTGDLVYFVAGIVILHNLNTQIQRHYVEHTDDIKCMALHPDKVTFATGQVAGHSKVEGKPHVRIWSSISLQTLHTIGLGFFERAVSALGFSKLDGGKLLCTVDEANDHNITVWNWATTKSICTSKSSTEAVIEAEFNPTDNNVIVTCGKNHLAFWILEKSTLVKKMAIFEKYEKPKFTTCVTFTSNGELITGDSSGNIFFWSREKRSITSAILQAHNGPIFSLFISEAGSLLSGGGKDHAIIEWDLSTKEKSGRNIQLTNDHGFCRTISEVNDKLVVGTTNNAIIEITGNDGFVNLLNGHSDEVWGIDSHPSKEQFITGGHDRKLILWDALTHTVLLSKQFEKNIQSISFSPTADLVAIGCIEGHWYVSDASEFKEIFQGKDGNEPIQSIEFSPDGSHLAVGSRDNFIYIYKVNHETKEVAKVGKCSGHSSFITHLDWSTDGSYLRSNSGDYELLFWNIPECKQLTAASTLSDVKWHSTNCTLTFEVAGIWPEGSDGTDINAVTKAHKKLILATADDFGKVNLYRYPACTPKTAHKIYKGHSSHVTGVKFLVEDHRLTSTGGQDTAIVQWVLA